MRQFKPQGEKMGFSINWAGEIDTFGKYYESLVISFVNKNKFTPI